MTSTTTLPRRANAPSAPGSQDLAAIGIGIDTARYGHMVSFLRPDRQPAAQKLLVLENHASYQALRERLEQLHQQHPQAHFHIRIDAAGQYANNLERFLRGLPWPLTLSIGEPKRNRDYQKAHFPKRQTDETESIAMARFAVVEEPAATAAVPKEIGELAEVAGRLQAQTKQTTQTINRLHNLLARVFPELANVAKNVAAAWVLNLLTKYPSAAKIGQARLASLQNITYLSETKAQQLHQVAVNSVSSFRGAVAETLVRHLVAEVRHSQETANDFRSLLTKTYEALPAGKHTHLSSIPGIGVQTAAILVAKIIDIDRFATPEALVNYFGIFPEEHTSGVDKQGRPLPPGTMVMSPRGNDLVRAYLWMAALSGIRSNPALRALYRRLKAKGKRGDVAMGHCMRKLLHLVYAIWKTGKPFDAKHYPWIQEDDTLATQTPATEAESTPPRRQRARARDNPFGSQDKQRKSRGPQKGSSPRKASGHHGSFQRRGCAGPCQSALIVIGGTTQSGFRLPSPKGHHGTGTPTPGNLGPVQGQSSATARSLSDSCRNAGHHAHQKTHLFGTSRQKHFPLFPSSNAPRPRPRPAGRRSPHASL